LELGAWELAGLAGDPEARRAPGFGFDAGFRLDVAVEPGFLVCDAVAVEL
jgi:hypothetical protein